MNLVLSKFEIRSDHHDDGFDWSLILLDHGGNSWVDVLSFSVSDVGVNGGPVWIGCLVLLWDLPDAQGKWTEDGVEGIGVVLLGVWCGGAWPSNGTTQFLSFSKHAVWKGSFEAETVLKSVNGGGGFEVLEVGVR